MNVKILGCGCANFRRMEVNVKEAAKKMGIEAEFENVTDMREIVSYGVMRTPALVIDGQVVSSGRVLSVSEAEKLIR